MRAPHSSHSLPAFPVYSSAFISPNKLVLGGGGGASRSGIKNKIRLYDISAENQLDLVDEFELEKDEDAPMSMAADQETQNIVCGINSALQSLEKGINDNCRLFEFREDKLTHKISKRTLSNGDTDDFQKVTVLSPDNTLLAVGGKHDLSLFSFPSLSLAAKSLKVEKGEIYDVTFSSSTLVVLTTVNVLVYELPSGFAAAAGTDATASPSSKKKKGKAKEKPKTTTGAISNLKLIKTVPIPSYFDATASSSYRAARYHPTNSEILYTIVNSVPQKVKKAKTPSRSAYLVEWETVSWTVVGMRKISDYGLTCFDVSANGKFLAYGMSDCTIGLLDSSSLHPLITILKAHDFPPTTLKFNQTSTLLVSGSADNSVRVVTVPTPSEGSSYTLIYFLVFALIALVLAVLAELFYFT